MILIVLSKCDKDFKENKVVVIGIVVILSDSLIEIRTLRRIRISVVLCSV